MWGLSGSTAAHSAHSKIIQAVEIEILQTAEKKHLIILNNFNHQLHYTILIIENHQYRPHLVVERVGHGLATRIGC